MIIGAVSTASLASAVWSAAARSLTQFQGVALGWANLSITTVSSISLTAVATTSVLARASKAGVMMITGSATGTTLGTGSVTSFLDIIVDGNTMSIPLYTGQAFDSAGVAVANSVNGAGGSSGNSISFQLFIGYTTSLTVQLRITASTLSAGTATITVMDVHN